jgi:hypothetical protein
MSPIRLLSVRPLVAAAAVLALSLAACSGSTASPSSAAASASPSASVAASAASPAAASPSSAGASLVLPSLPSLNGDPDLESKLPSTFCGAPTTKLSFAGADATSDADFTALIQKLGKSPSDASVATAGVTSGECAGIALIALRVKGADQGQFEQEFLAVQNAKPNGQATKANVGGKDVWTFTDSSTKNYIYFKGDTIFGVTAKDDASAAKGLAVMP